MKVFREELTFEYIYQLIINILSIRPRHSYSKANANYL